jgi:Mg-chelatase subunit ChlD
MNPDSPIDPRSALEASLTALLLGELPHDQAAALHQKLAQDAELAKTYERLKHTVNLVRETVACPAAQTADQPTPLKLSEQRRQKLLQHFKTVAPKEFAPPRRRPVRWLVPLGIAAALVLLLASIAVPNFTKARTSSLRHSFRTWSASESAAPAPSAANVDASSLEEQRTQLARPRRKAADDAVPQQTVKAGPPSTAVAGFKFAGSAIVLPQSGELADATTASPVLEGGNSWSVSASSRGFYGGGFYGDSSGRTGGVGGSGAVGDSFFAQPEAKVPSEAPNTVLAWQDNTHSKQADVTLAAADSHIGDPEWVAALTKPSPTSTDADAFKHRYAYLAPPATASAAAGAPPPAVVPPPVATDTPHPQATDAVPSSNYYDGSTITAVGDVPAMNKPTDATASAVTLQGLTTTAGAKLNLMKVPIAPTTPPAALASPEEAKSKDLLASGLQPSPSSSWHGGSMFGPPAPETAPSGGAANSDRHNVPLLGELPAAGQLFRSRPEANDDSASANLRTPATPKDVAWGGVQAGVVTSEHLGVATNFVAANTFGLAQAPMTPLSDTTISGYVDTSAQWNFGTGNANVGSLGRTHPNNTTIGGAFYSLDPEKHRVVNVGDADKSKSAELAYKEGQELKKSTAESEKPGQQNSEPYSVNVVGYYNGATTATNSITLAPAQLSTLENPTRYRQLSQLGTDAEPASRAARSPIVLPKAAPDTGPTLKDSSIADQKSRQFANAAGISGKALSELQVASDVNADNTPKEPRTVQILRRLEFRREGEAKHEPDEGKRVNTVAPAPIPQPEVQTADNAFSTFSLNVSDVSFKLAAASLERGVMPEPATVRSEEFINAFDYRDPEPPPGVPVAFVWERAQYPFAQNRDLLRFSIKTAALGRQPGRPLNIVLLLDNSGSMERADRVRIIREALRVLAGQLQPQDKFSVVTFARTAHLWVDGVPGDQAAKVAEEVSGLTPQGGTNLEDAMNLAYQTALRHYLANGVNRVVLLTDGAANLGNVDPEALKQKVEANRKQGVALDCFGIGWEGYNDDLLEVLSRDGDGRYAFLNTPEEVADEFAAKLAGALQVAASDVKVQVEFNPARVAAYRQIGYAKHQLTKEQFRDNTVNAAQIGAAEAGNALYTVEVNPAGTGPLCTVRARFRIPGTADYREHAWDVPFNGNAVALEQASPAMRLAVTGSALSEWLASSPYATEVTPDRLLGYLSGVPEVYGADARPKKLEWMIRQAKSIAGK